MRHFNKGKIVKEYFKYQEEYREKYGQKTVILYQKGMFMELYSKGEDGKLDFYTLCDILQIQSTKCEKKLENSENNPNLAGFPVDKLPKFSRLLLQEGYTCVIIKERLKIKEKEEIVRYLDCILSPSTSLDETIDIHSSNTYLLCTYIEFEKTNIIDIGLSYIDLTIGKSYIIDVKCDKNIDDNIIGHIKTIDPKEIVIYTKNYENTKEELINKFLLHKYTLHMYDKFDNNISKPSYQNTFLDKIFPDHGMLTVIEYLGLEKYPSSIVSFVLLLNFAYEHNANILNKIIKPVISKQSKILELSYNTITQLNLLSGKDELNSKFSSLYSILNQTSTIMGRRLLKDRLLCPITNTKILKSRYDDIEKMMNKYENEFVWQLCEDKLKYIRDLERLTRRINLKKLQPAEFLDMHNSYEKLIEIIELFNTINGNVQFQDELSYAKEAPCSSQIKYDELERFNHFYNYYKDHLNLDVIGKYNMESNFTESIFNRGVYQDIDNLEDELKKTWKSFRKFTTSIEQLSGESNFIKIENSPSYGYFISISKGKKKFLQKMNDYEFIFKDNSSKVRVFSPVITNFSSTIIQLQSDIKELNREKFIVFLEEINEKYNDTLISISNFIANLDLTKSISKVSETNKYCRPKIKNYIEDANGTKRSYIIANDVRHTLMERFCKTKYVANSVEIGKNKNGMILTSLNYSGKSSLLRAVGMNLILAQCGFFCSSSSFTFFPFKKIFTKIAVQDNIFSGKSTFMSEILELKNAVENSDKNTLLLFDEPCIGSDIFSGMSLLASSISRFVKNKTNFMIATHFHKLYDLEQIKSVSDKVKFYHLKVSIINDTLQFDRILCENKCEQEEYGIEIASFLKMDKDIIEDAYKIRKLLSNNEGIILKKSRYNKDFFLGECYVCNSKNNLHCHHLHEQKCFKVDNDIPFDKDAIFNLCCLCEKCHQDVHKNKIVINGYKETSEGLKLEYKKI